MLKTSKDFERVADNIVGDLSNFKQLIVLSAPFGQTDCLYGKIDTINKQASEKFKSLLLATGEQHSLSQIGLILEKNQVATDYMYGTDIPLYTNVNLKNSDILSVALERIKQKLAQFDVILVAGFQGFNIESQKITTLGRGGSDLTASVLSTVLNCPCFFFKDTGGIGRSLNFDYKNLYSNLSYEEIVELSHSGSKIINDKASLILSSKNTEAYFGSLENYKQTSVSKVEVSRVDNIQLSQNAFKITVQSLSPTSLRAIERVFTTISINKTPKEITIMVQKKIGQPIDSSVLHDLECLMIGKIVAVDVIHITGSGLLHEPYWYLKEVESSASNIYKILCSQFKVSIIMDDKNNEHTLAILRKLKESLVEFIDD